MAEKNLRPAFRSMSNFFSTFYAFSQVGGFRTAAAAAFRSFNMIIEFRNRIAAARLGLAKVFPIFNQIFGAGKRGG